MFNCSFGIEKITEVDARIGVDVAVAVAFGNVAVCDAVPIETKATFGPSLTMRILLPMPGSAALALAVDVTLTGCVFDCAVNGNGCM